MERHDDPGFTPDGHIYYGGRCDALVGGVRSASARAHGGEREVLGG